MAETNIKDVKLKIGTDEQFQSKLKDLPLNTLVGITDPIQEGELDSSIIDKLDKADNSLQKPTTTLAKESFVKVGIDGTQKFDESSYVVAPSTGGTVGQVLKKTETGSEWANESGGGKYYIHDVTIRNNSEIELPIVKFKYISTDNNTFSLDKFNFYKCFDAYANNNSTPPKFYGVKDMSTSASSISITYYTTYPFDVMSTATLPVQIADIKINDNIVEL